MADLTTPLLFIFDLIDLVMWSNPISFRAPIIAVAIAEALLLFCSVRSCWAARFWAGLLFRHGHPEANLAQGHRPRRQRVKGSFAFFPSSWCPFFCPSGFALLWIPWSSRVRRRCASDLTSDHLVFYLWFSNSLFLLFWSEAWARRRWWISILDSSLRLVCPSRPEGSC